MDNDWWVFMIPLAAVIGGLTLAGLSLHHRARLRELAYRERIALIEKGIVPPPDLDPARFEAEFAGELRPRAQGDARYRSGGVVLVGVGLALMLLIGFTSGATDVAIGVGGALAILGGALIVNGLLNARSAPVPPRVSSNASSTPSAPASPGDAGAPPM